MSTWAVLSSAGLQKAATVKRAQAVARSTVLSLEISIFVGIQPALALAILIREFPDWAALEPRFVKIAPGIMAAAAIEVRENNAIAVTCGHSC